MNLTPMVIDGQPVTTAEASDIRSPFDDRLVGSVPKCGPAEIDRAVTAAAARLAEPLPTHERAMVLDRAAVALTERAEEFARGICDEAAKPIRTARVEVERAADTFRFAAAVARTLAGEVIPLDASAPGAGKLGFTLRVPIGVVAAVTPFNFPLNLVAHKVAPAIAAGCPVVVKPASATPLTALRLAELLERDAGLPAGWLNVVTCDGHTADHLVTHPDVAMVTFTGSATVGWGIKARAPRKHVNLELGNNAPLIVDTGVDVDDVARRVALAANGFAGQSCISVQRVYVLHEIEHEFTAALAAATDALVVGDPADDATDVSALITPADTTRVLTTVTDAVDAGARVLCGGTVLDLGTHGVLAPTVLTNVERHMAVSATEVFGPVVGVRACATIDEAINRANDTAYGLQAGIFTNDLRTGLEAAQRLRFGGVTVNEVPTWRADQMPYGGVGESGNTKEGPRWAVRDMTVERMVIIGN
jgi:acyl-CoA reductase-like NAD-dependent aldehyde dehydrogenase